MNKFKVSIHGIWTHIILVGFGIGIFTLPMFLLRRSHVFLEVGEKFLKGQQGIFTKKELNTNLKRIDAVSVNQSWLGRKLNYGNVLIQSGSSIHTFKDIERPQELKYLIEGRI